MLVASVASAGEFVTFSDDFTGADGTTVAPGTDWGYENVGVEDISWTTIPRPDAQDQYIITNNQLFMYVGPCTNDPTVYNKVQAAIWPIVGGTRGYVVFTNGEVTASFDLNEVIVNEGHAWALNQEVKLNLAAGPITLDPDAKTNSLAVKCSIRPNGLDGVGNVSNVQITAYLNTPTNRVNFPGYQIDGYPITPFEVKIVLEKSGMAKVYVGGVMRHMTNALDFVDLGAVDKIYPYIWHGMFQGRDSNQTVPTDGKTIIDNFNVQWTPEPGAFALLVLALPLLRKLG
jgi:hypothetical protein